MALPLISMLLSSLSFSKIYWMASNITLVDFFINYLIMSVFHQWAGWQHCNIIFISSGAVSLDDVHSSYRQYSKVKLLTNFIISFDCHSGASIRTRHLIYYYSYSISFTCTQRAASHMLVSYRISEAWYLDHLNSRILVLYSHLICR